MTEPKKIEQLSQILVGITRSEWLKIKEVIDNLYDSEVEQVELSNSESIQTALSAAVCSHEEKIIRMTEVIHSAIRDMLEEAQRRS